MGHLLCRLVADDDGADLVEYGLLTAIIGVSGLLFAPLIMSTMGTAYGAWNTAAQNAWEPCNPGGCY